MTNAKVPDGAPTPMPYRGAYKLLSEGLPAAQAAAAAPASSSILVEVVNRCADILTVEMFGNQQQRAELRHWMQDNRERGMR